MLSMTPYWLPRPSMQSLLDALLAAGYRCVGPKAENGAIVFGPLRGVDELPRGYHDRQAPGQYRLAHTASERLFAWANGPQALKPLTFAPRETLWRVERDAAGALCFVPTEPAPEKIAVIGVRACDLAALALQEQHFLRGPYPDPAFAARRANMLLLAVNCTHPAATCFCASTGDGPGAQSGFDLALTEADDGFLIQAGTESGAAILRMLALDAATAVQCAAATQSVRDAAAMQQRALPSRNLKDALFANLDHARWDEVAARCLACGNCTSVCPTCFCHSEIEHSSSGGVLDLDISEHSREWDSCFTPGHSYFAGKVLRADTRTRYRQWLTHKLGGWHDQYGRSGCVGCGRCIAWCPTGIDLTEEAAAICGAHEHA